MTNKANDPRTTPLFFDAKGIGKSLREVGVEYLKVESRDVRTRWFRGPHDVDLFLWIDESQIII